MNKNCYRVIFNKTRQAMMVVAELLPSAPRASTKKASLAVETALLLDLKPLRLAVMLISGSAAVLSPIPSAAAGIAADGRAPAGQQPSVTNAANGVPLVNIQTPSAAGISRNTYSQFDVDHQGAILNNSKTNVQTQLGGWVQGNPNLTGSTARVILNEVNSSNPSLLNGYVEIAGSRAQLVIANPSGISCDGCGFINANRATLTTGVPIVDNGALVGYRVEGGTVSFDGNGMDSSQATYTDIIARAVQVNAGIWANQLNVIAGTNQVSIDSSGNQTSVTPIASDGSAPPAFSVDVAALGGMYAGKIRLIGTETGLGVRNAGEIGASSGEVEITADGQLINSNTITARTDMRIQTGGVDNRGGTLVAGGLLHVATDDINNSSGYIGANDLAVNSSAAINTGGILSAEQSLTLASSTLTGDGQVLSAGDLTLDLDSNFTNQNEIIANGNLTFVTSGTLTNSGTFNAGSTLSVSAANLANTAQGEISGAGTTLNVTGTVTNRGLLDGGNTFLSAGAVNNIGTGRIYGDHVAISATTLTNTNETLNGITSAATIAARDRLDIGAGSITNGTGALIFSGGDMAIGGSLDSSHFAAGTAGSIINTSASIESLGDLDISADSLLNQRETFSMSRVLLSSTSRYWEECVDDDCDYVNHITQQTYNYEDQVTSTSPEATISAAGNANLAVDQLSNKYSTIQAGGNLDLVGSTLTNQGAELYHVTSTITSKNLIHWGDRDHGTTVTSSTSSYLIDTVPATITAGNTLSGTFTSRIDNVSIREHTAPLADTNGEVPSALTTTSINLSNSSLFHTASNPAAGYLIETDPRFADYGSWLSSDYMMGQLSFDPDITQKRLGDGFYEQRLVREQIAELTGRRFLTGYSSDEAQYQALMSNALTQMDGLSLIPGVALTAAQIAQLTSDIVWLVEQDVTLPDGTVTKALVPQVYVRLQDGDLSSSGALLAGQDVHLKVTGDPSSGEGAFNTSGTVAGRNVVTIDAANVSNVRGLIEGKDVGLSASQDINIEGGTVKAEDSLIATAGKDINVRSTTTDLHVGLDGTPTYVDSHAIDRVAGLYVSNPNAILVASAGNDVNLMAAAIQNSGDTTITAGHDINLGVVKETSNSYAKGRNSWRKEKSSTEIGSVIQTSGDITMAAGNDFKATAASVSSDAGELQVNAAKDITITAGTNTFESDSYRKIKKSGGFGSSKKEYWESTDQVSHTGSTFSADTVALQAGSPSTKGNISVQGSNVVSTNGTLLEATGDVAIKSVANTLDESRLAKKKSSGFGVSGASVSYGTSKLKTNQTTHSVTQSGSTVGSTDGDVVIAAGKTYTQSGSDVLAPKGDIDISAQKVDITSAQETWNQSTETKFKQSGITVSISNPVVSAVQTVDQMRQSASETSDARMKALAAATTALTVKNAYEAVNKGMTNPDASTAQKLGGVDVSISIGTSKSSSNSTQSSATVVGSQVVSGGDVTITATGAAKNSDINVMGSHIDAGGDATLVADDQINLIAAKNTSTSASNSKNSGASVGISVGTNGVAATVSASKGKGKSNGTDVSWTEAVVQSGNTTSLVSGGDANLIGAQVKGEQVIAEVGTTGKGNLNIESLQDTSSYDSKSKSGGFSVSVPIGPGNYGASLSSSSTKINSDYASVDEQAGIFAGDHGFQVNVAGSTDLKGAVIASTQQAIQDNKNNLTTETLTVSNIENHAEYEGESSSLSAGVGRHISEDGATTNAPSASAGYASQEDEANSITLSGVSGGTVAVTDNTGQVAKTGEDSLSTIALLNRDVHIDEDGNAVDSQGNSTAATITPIFDQQKVERELNAAVTITQAFSLVVPKAVGDFAKNKFDELEKEAAQALEAGNTDKANELKAEAAKWDEGGAYRIALHAAIGGLITGDLTGAASAGAIAGAAPLLNELQEAIQEKLEESGLDDSAASNISQALAELTSFGIGNAIGGTAGAAASLPIDTNNRQLHPTEAAFIKRKAAAYAAKRNISVAQAEEELTRGALYANDAGWQSAYEDYSPEEVAAYKAAASYLESQAYVEGVTFINSEGKQQAAFISTQTQFNNEKYLLTQAFSDPQTRSLYTNNAVIAVEEMGIGAGFTFGKNAAIGFGSGVPAGVEDALKGYAALLDSNTYAKLVDAAKIMAADPSGTMEKLAEGLTGQAQEAAFDIYLNWLQKDSQDLGKTSGKIFGNVVVDLAASASGIKIVGLASDTAADIANLIGRRISIELDKIATNALIESGGVFDYAGNPILDLKSLTNDQKRIMGELFGENTVKQIIPDGSKLARLQSAGTTGIDDLYKVTRPDVDYVVIEYKFVSDFKKAGVSALDNTTKDGLQGSSSWLLGSNRIEKAVGSEVEAAKVQDAIRSNKIETWVVTTRVDGSTEIQVLDALGKSKSIDTSKLLSQLSVTK